MQSQNYDIMISQQQLVLKMLFGLRYFVFFMTDFGY